MKIGLLDVDRSKFPNLALMKISAYHKANGDEVRWFNCFDHYDKVYMSKVFESSRDFEYPILATEIIKGGVGYDRRVTLPEEIEAMSPDYSIYPNCNFSLQFFSRGCINACPFCVVHEKEGGIRAVAPMALNPNGKHIKVLDNNFFASPKWAEAVDWLVQSGQKVDLQGIDARIITVDQMRALNRLKVCKRIHTAWDNPKQDLEPQLVRMNGEIRHRLMCYVLIGYWSTEEEDLYRVETLRRIGIDPYVMPYDKKKRYQQRFARWVNHKATFKSTPWSEYRK